MALAMHNMADALWNGSFPPAAICSKDDTPLLSWKVALLPFIEEGNLYKSFHLDEPWDSPHNLELIPRIPKMYAGRRENHAAKEFKTYYRVFVGPDTLQKWSKPSTQKILETKRINNTFLIVEGGEPVIWTKPEEYEYDPNAPLPTLGGLIPKDPSFRVVLWDGSTLYLEKNLPEQELRHYITGTE